MGFFYTIGYNLFKMVEVDTGSVQTCKHHWIIDSPTESQRYSPGMCMQKSCGETRLFDNCPENDRMWEIRLERIPTSRSQAFLLEEFTLKFNNSDGNF